ncbi:MAG TPA: aldo/keto reductase [Candidatus Krumholzibacteria bacterium]|nr:aldo/keto reductase [Candidatus Krumholzibacteria bacterium]HPD70774.1 aldo/keto reductase [Candidatus Krumholzibacteria bacterium]HRY39526.1 aldo/keto reductase [Candidatus Krumholzibacteria bacterium]
MEYRHLGRSGLRVSALGFGSWITFGDQLGEDAAYQCMKTAYDAGVNFFDNAEAYAMGEAETIMGKVLKRAGWARSDLVVSTKVFWGGAGPNDRGLSRKHVFEGMYASLDRLDLDYVDLVYCHRPDLHTPIEETVRAMSDVVTSGMAFYWGTSEWSAEQIRHAAEIAAREHLVAPTMEQPQYNLLVRERVESEYAPLYRDLGLGTTVWSPLASGILSGKYNDGIPPDSRLGHERYAWLRRTLEGEEGAWRLRVARDLAALASELGCTPSQLALAWCLKNPQVSSVITGASRPAQVVENLAALAVAAQLTPEVMDRIDAFAGNRPAEPKDWRTM